MNHYFLYVAFVALIPFNALAHSGGTDSNGCHSGSQPYHCHSDKNGSGNGTSISTGAWDLNVGYQYQIEETKFIPFLGASVGTSEEHDDAKLGANLGIKLDSGWYASYVSTSKSVQLGYSFFHISANSDYFGLGLRFPFTGVNDNSAIYYSGSMLFSGSE